MRKSILSLASAAFLAVLLVAPAEGQVHIGPQVSYADDADFGIGARVVAGVPDYAGFEVAGSFDYFFPEVGDYWEINGNLLYNFQIEGNDSFRPYAGGGLNVANFSNGTSNTEVGANLVGGAKFATDASTTPYLEARYEIEGGEQFVLTAGLLFP